MGAADAREDEQLPGVDVAERRHAREDVLDEAADVERVVDHAGAAGAPARRGRDGRLNGVSASERLRIRFPPPTLVHDVRRAAGVGVDLAFGGGPAQVASRGMRQGADMRRTRIPAYNPA